jgi:hypothetical protein
MIPSHRARSRKRAVTLTLQVSAGPWIVTRVWTPQVSGSPYFSWTKSGQLYLKPQVRENNVTAAMRARSVTDASLLSMISSGGTGAYNPFLIHDSCGPAESSLWLLF